MARRCGAKHVFKLKCTKHHMRGPIWKFRRRKMARSTFASQNVQSTACLDHFLVPKSKNGTRLWREAHFQVKMLLKFRSRKMARRCGAKHSCKSKCTIRHMFGPVFEVPMSKNGTSLWRSTIVSQHVQNTCILAHFWTFRFGKGVRQKT